MKTQFLAAVLFLFTSPLFAVETPAEDRDRDVRGIKALIERQVEAWKDMDAAAFTKEWARDGDLINPVGDTARGRDAIKAMIVRDFAGAFAGTKAKVTIEKIRRVKRGVYVADLKWVIVGMRLADGSTADQDVHVTSVFKRTHRRFQLAAVRAFIFKKAWSE